MAVKRIERKRKPTLWLWLAGLVLLALLIWAIAELINTDPDNPTLNQGAGKVSAGGDPVPAAMAVAAGVPGSFSPAREQPGIGRLGALMPLGLQDTGQVVGAGGVVLTKPAHGGFWLRSDANIVIWVKTRQMAKPGQEIQRLVGRLARARPGQVGTWLRGSDVQAQATRNPGWQLVTELYMDTSADDPLAPTVGDSPAARGAAAHASSGNRR